MRRVFFVLSLTGMSLKFSYSGWAQFISRTLGGFETMGLLHRMGAITLFVIFFLHIWDVLRQKRTKKRTWLQMLSGPDTMMFTLTDLKQVVQSIRWFFGIGPRPTYGRYTYCPAYGLLSCPRYSWWPAFTCSSCRC